MTEKKFFPNLQSKHLQQIDDKNLWATLSGNLQNILRRSRDELFSSLESLRLRERDTKSPYLFQKWRAFIKEGGVHQIVLDVSYSGPGGGVSQHIVKTDTFLVLEGLIVSAYILNASVGYIYVPASEKALIQHLEAIITMFYEEGIIRKEKETGKWAFDLHLHYGEVGFIGVGDCCVSRSMDATSKEGMLFGGICCVMQPETAAILPQALIMGPENFLKIGTPDSVGHKVLSFSGHVNHVGFVEVPFGVSLKSVITENCRGVRGGWSHAQMIFPNSAFSRPILKSNLEDLCLSYEMFEAHNFSIGSGEMVVVNNSMDAKEANLLMGLFFLQHIPFDACFMCHKALPWLMHLMENHIRFGERGRQRDIKNIHNDLITGCACTFKESYIPLINALFHQVVEDIEVAMPSEQAIGV